MKRQLTRHPRAAIHFAAGKSSVTPTRAVPLAAVSGVAPDEPRTCSMGRLRTLANHIEPAAAPLSPAAPPARNKVHRVDAIELQPAATAAAATAVASTTLSLEQKKELYHNGVRS
jgi:hypothetical protein